MKRLGMVMGLLVVCLFTATACTTKDECTADSDCAAGYACGEDQKCHELKVTLSFPDITSGKKVTTPDDVDKSDETIQLDIAITATATTGTVRDGTPITFSVTYPTEETNDDDHIADEPAPGRSVTYPGILVSGLARFLRIPFPVAGAYTLTAYLTESPSVRTTVSITVDYTVAPTLVMRYYKGGTTPMMLEGATLDDNDDLDKNTAAFQVKMEAVTTGFPEGQTVQLFIDTETPELVGEAAISSHVALFPSVTVPVRKNIVLRVKSGDFEDTLSFDAITENACTFTVNIANNSRFGMADDEAPLAGLQKTLVISDVAVCSAGSAIELYINHSPGTDKPDLTLTLGSTTLERQITLPESASKNDVHTVTIVMKNDDTSATGHVTVTGIFVDLTPPTLEVTAPLADTVFLPSNDTNDQLDGLQIEVTGTVNDALSDSVDVGVYYQSLLKGDFTGTGEFTIADVTFLETDEAAALLVTARDAVGNETSVTVPIRVYVNEPTIAFQAICNRIPTMHMPLAMADDTDEITKGLQCAIVVRTNNLAAETTEVSLAVNSDEPLVATIGANNLATFDPVSLPEGEVTLTAAVTNLGTTHTSQITVDVDTIAPTVTITQAPTTDGGISNSTSATFGFSCSETGCSFRYRLDSSAWSAYDTASTALFTGLADGEHTFAVQARDLFGNEGTAATFAWTIDATPPTTPVVTGTTPTNDTTPTWSWNAVTDAVEYRWSFDESTWTVTTDTSYTPDTPLAEGDYTLYVQARDTAGNWSESGSFTITVDTTAPAAPVVTGTTPTNDTTPTWSWNAVTDAVEYRWSFDESAWTVTTDTSYTPDTSLAEGDYTLYVQARDAAGNWSASGSFTTTVDTSAPAAPVVTGTTPTNDTTPTWSWNAVPDAVEYRFSFTEGPNWGYTAETTYTPGAALTDGDYTLYVQARDAAGNWSESGSFTITVDTTPPVVLIDPAAPCTRRLNGTFTFSVTGGAAAITCRFEKPGGGSEEGPCLGSYDYTLDAGDGTYTLTVLAEDAAGNSADSSISITLNTTTPTFQWYLPPSGTSYKAGSSVPTFVFRTKNLEPGETVEIWDADANTKVAEKETAGSLCNATEDVGILLDLPDKCGTYKLYATVYDSVDGTNRYTDNLTTLPATTRSFTFDRNKPVITSFTVTNDANHDNTLVGAEDLDGIIANGMQTTIVVTIQDAIDIGRTVTLRNKTSGTLYTATVAGDRTATFANITLPEGSNNLAATLIDCGGNVSDEAGAIILVDTTPPAVLFQGPTGATPGHALWLTARDGIVNGDDELTGQILSFKITGDWNGATPVVRHIVYDYTDTQVGPAYTFGAGEMNIFGTTVTIDLDASSDPYAPLAYNKHRFEVTVQDAYGNTRVATRTYEVDPIVPEAVIAYPTTALLLDDTKDEDPSTSGVQFTLKLNLTKLATPTGSASTIDITAIPITAIGGSEDTTRARKSWNGFTATSDGDDQTFPNDGSFLRVGDGFWRLMVTVTDDHLNVFESATVDVEVDTDVACFTLKLAANDKMINGRQNAPTWLNTSDGNGAYDLYVETDAPNGSTATLVVNGSTTYGPATVTNGRADFAAVTLLTGGVENTLALTVNNGVMPATDTYYVRADITEPTLDAGDMNPLPYVHGDIWEIGYGFDDDTNHDTTSVLELTDASPNRLIFIFGGIEAVSGYTTHGTVTLTAVSPAGAIGGTMSTAIVEAGGGDMTAEFTNLTFEDSVIGGQTDIEMKVTVTEQPSGNTFERTIFVHLNLERPEPITPVVTTNAARGSAFVQWNAVAGNNSAYGTFPSGIYEYQVKYEAYNSACSLDDNESVFDSGVAVVPLTGLSVADPSLNSDGFVEPKAAGESQSYRFYFKKQSNNAHTVTADIHQNGDKYCFAVRASDGIYAQDGTILATNTSPVLSTSVVDKGAVQLTAHELIAPANDGQTHPGQMKYIGDLNGDGVTDFVFSDVRLQKVSVFISNIATGIPNRVELIKPSDAGTNFGLYVSNGGDFTGDGKLDILVYGAPNQVHLYTGTGNTMNTIRTGDMITTSDAISEIEAIGDFNGDGVEDFAVGQNTYSSNTGKVDIFFGSANTSALAAVDVTYVGATSGDRFGSGLRRAGDLNHDGFGDFAAGTRDSETKVKILYGSTSPTGGTVTYDFSVFGNNAIRKAFYGYIDGDSYDDLAIVGGSVMYIYKGSATGVIVPASWTEGVNRITHSAILTELLGNEGTNGTLAANCTGQMRDIDGDGYADVFLTGAYAQYLLSGTGSFLTLHPSVYINKPIASASASVLVIENGLVICDRTSGKGDCMFYAK